ncbi:type III PLP-dependent enzyme [Methanolobus bombayensis]|uniref:type III PLP-dependent enzyme n=1 Tax=Methanolobus bombayensis TaxID=38023 RepID=UPI001AE1E33B|nr:type III PLP-dependent enzyme [Methanolobus bombayensis]MBP1908464.1 ornithine decarboxylase [Methanolobus bombayensis]
MRKAQYKFHLSDFISEDDFKIIKDFSKDKETPFLIIDLSKVEEMYDELVRNMPYVKIYYAVKANPLDEIISALRDKGSNFDAATVYEIGQLLRLGVSPERISYGNTIKKEKDIAYAYQNGIRLFATDSESDLLKIARNAPDSKVFFRLLTESDGADWPLSRKFGAHPDMIYELILQAKELGLDPYGLSFHVGSQQRDIGQWDNALSKCKYLFEAVGLQGIELKMINLGGGFPAKYVSPANELETYAHEILRFIKEDFGDNHPEIIIEPGRSLTADAGVIVTEVIMISKKAKLNQYKWVYLDIGKFGGLIETLDESIKYPIYSESKGFEEEVILAGPTCDSMDILYERYKYTLPMGLKENERLFIFTAGAYTQSYSSVAFNGFPSLKAYVI